MTRKVCKSLSRRRTRPTGGSFISLTEGNNDPLGQQKTKISQSHFLWNALRDSVNTECTHREVARVASRGWPLDPLLHIVSDIRSLRWRHLALIIDRGLDRRGLMMFGVGAAPVIHSVRREYRFPVDLQINRRLSLSLLYAMLMTIG